MPAYRPANRNLDYNERTAGTGAGEFVFIQVMLHGVWLNAVCLLPTKSVWMTNRFIGCIASMEIHWGKI
jgi:hypothetical protein